MNSLIEELVRRHTHGEEIDQEQLEVALSASKRLAVQAPAGYGKTTTMVSKIAYLMASGQVPNPKRILALTFSVNAACRIRKSVADSLPQILPRGPVSPFELAQRVLSTNYHGLCRRVLSRYGYLLDPHLRRFARLRGIDDSSYRQLARLDVHLSKADKNALVSYGAAVKKAGAEFSTTRRTQRKYLATNLARYLSIVKRVFLPHDFIPFNAILLFTRKLFHRCPEIREFYRSFFPILIVDEFQDTNILQWALLQDLFGRPGEAHDETSLVVFGDPLQRIYGFIGAIQNILDRVVEIYDMEVIELKTNHRFKDNEHLLRLDQNIRCNASNPRDPAVDVPAHVPVLEADTQDDEVCKVSRLIRETLAQQPDASVAVLVRIGSKSSSTMRFPAIFDRISDSSLSYFYALYGDADDDYVDFHSTSAEELHRLRTNGDTRSFSGFSRRFLAAVRAHYRDPSRTEHSLLTLLESLLDHTVSEYRFLTVEEKLDFVREVLENKALKQFLGEVQSNIVLSTVHGAKGLEWDYVVLPDMEPSSFPAYMGLCKLCHYQTNCELDWSKIVPGGEFEQAFFQELSVFYVAATRARCMTYFSYSEKEAGQARPQKSTKPSCLLRLSGIVPVACDLPGPLSHTDPA